MQSPLSQQNAVDGSWGLQPSIHQATQATDDASSETYQPSIHSSEHDEEEQEEEEEDEEEQEDDEEQEDEEHDEDGMSDDTVSPKIGYRTEYRHLSTQYLIREHYTTTGFHDHEDLLHDATGTVFEIVRTFFTKQKEHTMDTSTTRSWNPPSVSMRIMSVGIINALRSVVKYYPGQDLAGSDVLIQYPYPILVHHYDELREYSQQCAAKDPSELCVRERNAEEHLQVLLNFLDKEVMPDVRKEQERNERGFETWEHLWVSRKPGATMFLELVGGTEHTAGVIQSMSGGCFDTHSEHWIINYWTLVWDGDSLERHASSFRECKWDGQRATSGRRDILPMKDYWTLPNDPIVNQRVKFGKKWWSLIRRQCGHFRGRTARYPYNEGGFHIEVY